MRRVLVVLLLAGCASQPIPEFAGATATDRAACELEAEKHREYSVSVPRDRDPSWVRIYDACMRSKGYK